MTSLRLSWYWVATVIVNAYVNTSIFSWNQHRIRNSFYRQANIFRLIIKFYTSTMNGEHEWEKFYFLINSDLHFRLISIQNLLYSLPHNNLATSCLGRRHQWILFWCQWMIRIWMEFLLKLSLSTLLWHERL